MMPLPAPYRHPWTLDGIISANGFLNALGVRFVRLDEDGAILTLQAAAEHENVEERLHGGVLAALLDAASGFAVRFDGPGRSMAPAVTLSLAVSFVAATGDRAMTAHGRVVGGGKQTFFTYAEIRDGTGALIAMAQGTFKRLAAAEAPVPEDVT